MLLVIAYSCTTSAFFTAFDQPPEKVFGYLENIVFAAFSLEIILKFMKLPDNTSEDKVVTHSDIAKAYIKSGWFFFDLIATFPFYLIEDAGKARTWFKLMRLVRIPRVLKLLDAKKFNDVIRLLLNGQPRGKRVVL